MQRDMMWFAAAIGFWLLNVSLHLAFSNFIGARYTTPFGEFAPVDFTPQAAAVVSVLFFAFLARRWRRGEIRLLTGSAWVVVAGAMVGTMAAITTTRVEMIHFLQYGVVAWLLCRAFDAERRRWPLLTLMFMTLGLGIIDELNQFFYLTRPNSTYIDVNDFVLNQVGACAGLLAFYGFQAAPPARPAAWGRLQFATLAGYSLLFLATATLALTGHLAYHTDRPIEPGGIDRAGGTWVIYFERLPGLVSHWQPTFTTGEYYVLGAAEGSAVILLVAGLVYGFRLAAARND